MGILPKTPVNDPSINRFVETIPAAPNEHNNTWEPDMIYYHSGSVANRAQTHRYFEYKNDFNQRINGK